MTKNSESWTGLAKEVLDADNAMTRILCENYLSVALDIRPCSFLTTPAELPNSEIIARNIDESCREEARMLVAETDVNAKRVLIANLKSKLRKAFEENFYKFDFYKIHRSLVGKLHLRIYEVEVRPTIREIYLFKNANIKRKLASLMKIRQIARQKSILERQAFFAIYPEERLRDYMKSVGSLLGYPECCVNMYIKDRLSDASNVEQRASDQTIKLRESGCEPNHFAYFTRGFFPCSPTCLEAAEVGKKTYDTLRNVDLDLGNAYLQMTQENLKTVERFPELIKKHMQNLDERVQGFAETPPH